MGLVHAVIKLDNPQQAAIASISMQVLASTGALQPCIRAAMSRQLNLAAERMRRVTLADGRSVEAPYVGPVRVEMAGRTCFAGAMVFGDEVQRGAIPIEDMDLLVDRARVKPRQATPPLHYVLPPLDWRGRLAARISPALLPSAPV